MDHVHLVGCLLVTLDFGFDSDSYVHFYHRNLKITLKLTKNMSKEKNIIRMVFYSDPVMTSIRICTRSPIMTVARSLGMISVIWFWMVVGWFWRVIWILFLWIFPLFWIFCFLIFTYQRINFRFLESVSVGSSPTITSAWVYFYPLPMMSIKIWSTISCR